MFTKYFNVYKFISAHSYDDIDFDTELDKRRIKDIGKK